MLNGQGMIISEKQLIHHLVIKFNEEELKLAEWSYTRLEWKASNMVTDGLYRVAGKAIIGIESMDWSFIIKVIVPAPETESIGPTAALQALGKKLDVITA